MNSVEPSSPNVQLAVRWVVISEPRCLPSGERTMTPPGAVVHTLPCTSTAMPSAEPRLPFAEQFGMPSKNSWPSPMRAVLFHGEGHPHQPLGIGIGDVERLLIR